MNRFLTRPVMLCVAMVVIAVSSWWLTGCTDLSASEGIQTVCATYTIPFAVWFLVLYSREPWWRSAFPASLVAIAVAVLLYSLSVVLFRLFGDYPGRDTMLILSSLMTLVAMATRTLVLRHERINHPRP